jgi:hypothetical protein
MGSDDGRSGGTAVVDVNTKVYGTDNSMSNLDRFPFLWLPKHTAWLLPSRPPKHSKWE